MPEPTGTVIGGDHDRQSQPVRQGKRTGLYLALVAGVLGFAVLIAATAWRSGDEVAPTVGATAVMLMRDTDDSFVGDNFWCLNLDTEGEVEFSIEWIEGGEVKILKQGVMARTDLWHGPSMICHADEPEPGRITLTIQTLWEPGFRFSIDLPKDCRIVGPGHGLRTSDITRHDYPFWMFCITEDTEEEVLSPWDIMKPLSREEVIMMTAGKPLVHVGISVLPIVDE